MRFAFRTVRKAPMFAAVAIFSLALGIGANTAIFTLINQLLLELLPVKHPEELVLLTARGQHYGSNTGSNAISYPMYQDFRDRNQVFRGMFCRYGMSMSLVVDGRTERVSGELVSGNYFPVLGVGPALGRTFTAGDDLIQGGHPLAVLSYGFWKSRFSSDPDVIGRKIVVNGYPLTIVGVSQKGFDGVEPGYSPQIRVPMMMKHEMTAGRWYSLNDRRGRFVQAFGRLKPGGTLEQAKAGLQPLFHQILNLEVQQKEFAKASPHTKQQFLRMWMDVLPAAKGRSFLREQFTKPLMALMAIVALVLLIACSNVANLLIARATSRQKEIAVRLALGAGRVRLVRQWLVESLLLSVTGGLAGLLLAVWMDEMLLRFLPNETSTLTLSSTPDWRVLTFNLSVSVLTGLIFGLVPALQATRPELAGTLKDQAGSVTGVFSTSLRKGLVVAQVALSLLLLIGAGLFIRSLRNLKDLDPGFRTDKLVTFSVDPSLNGYKPERSLQFYRQLVERMGRIPGVGSGALAVVPVLDDNEWDSTVTVEGYVPKQGEWVDPHMQFVSPGFFATMGIAMPLGRDFDDRDVKGAPLVAIVNQKFAKRYFGDANPIGRHIGMGGDPGTKTDITIVGVVSDTKYENMRQEIPYELYRPYQQVDFVIGMTAYLRTLGEPDNLFSSIRQAVRQVDSNVPVYKMRTLEQQVDKSLLTERLLASLATAFGFLATLLAAIGLYGVMAYMVARRTREIGIRMALGATSPSVVWLVMREVLTLVGIGVAIGLPAAWGVTRLVQTQLYGITPNDPYTLALAVVGIAGTAIVSGYVPAQRATRVDPMRALRWE
ncbi:MAG TPA: ABC transporter permease [Bryobacteraceae bacterium]|nr:ABC transporter permease [Bryobacteraceae bacterium]